MPGGLPGGACWSFDTLVAYLTGSENDGGRKTRGGRRGKKVSSEEDNEDDDDESEEEVLPSTVFPEKKILRLRSVLGSFGKEEEEEKEEEKEE